MFLPLEGENLHTRIHTFPPEGRFYSNYVEKKKRSSSVVSELQNTRKRSLEWRKHGGVT